MSIHISHERGAPRRVVLSCDAPGCPVQSEPTAAESWRSDPDARAIARDHSTGWTHDPVRQTDYCPAHAELRTAPAAGVIAPRPTATARDEAGNPLNRDEYAALLRTRLSGAADGPAARAAVAARLLDELAGVYRGEALGTLAQEVSGLLDGQ